jgi:hypothetical protein
LNIIGAGQKILGINGAPSFLRSAGLTAWTGAGNIYCSYPSVFENDGTFTVQNDATFAGYTGGVATFVNNGTFRKTTTTGTTLFQQELGGGIVAFNNNGTVDLQTGSLALGGGGTGTNNAFSAAAGSVIDFYAGNFFFNGTQALLGAGTNRVSGATVTFNNVSSTMSGGNRFEIASGTVAGTNTVAGTGTVNWSGGIIAASLSLQSNIALNITGTAGKTLGVNGAPGFLRSAGPGTWTGTGTVSCGSTSVFENDGTFTVQNDATFAGYNGGVATFVNNGTVDLQTGSLAINGGYVLSDSPQLKLVLGGLNPGTQFSQETFGGAATLGGVLSVTLANGFSPTNGQSFAIVTYGSESGQFASQQLPALPITLAWQITYGATAVTLNVVRATIITDTTRLANGHFQFSLSGPSATWALIQASTNLLDWTPLQTNAPFTGSLLFEDAQAAGYPVRFYRVLLQP